MRRHQRRLLIHCLFIGAALSAGVIMLGALGVLTPLENALYDLRCRICQHFTPPPDNSLVQVDIDDAALETIGRWPWPRGTLARILDELHLAGPKAVELDLVLSDPQKVEYEPGPGAASRPASYQRIDNDAELASAIARLGNVIVPATFQSISPRPALESAMVQILSQDLELTPDQLSKRLGEQGFAVPAAGVGDAFYAARRAAMTERFRNLPTGAPLDLAHLRAALLPHTPGNVQSALTAVLAEQWARFQAARAFERFAYPAARNDPADPSDAAPNLAITLAPLAAFSNAASAGAFVDYPTFHGPIVRSIPLLIEHRGRIYPQMGLALACRMLDADLSRLHIIDADGAGAQLVIPRAGAGADLIIPLAPPQIASDGVRYACLMQIPWIGSRDWKTLYDWPAHRHIRAHLGIGSIWSACIERQKIIANDQVIDDAIRGILEAFGEIRRREDYTRALGSAEDFTPREQQARRILAEYRPFYDQAKNLPASQLRDPDRVFLASFAALEQVLPLNEALAAQLAGDRAALSRAMKGKAIIIGWTATAAVADFVPTPLHDKCPGAVVHGVIYNGIMTGELWSPLPWWISAVCAAGLGLVTVLLVAQFPPVFALLSAIALAGLFAVVDGTVLFDYGNRILPAAAPLCAIAVVWSGGTLGRVMLESAERNRITGRFRSYVDPKLVNYVLENPEARFDGEKREMTVVFTDLAGFTSLSEKLGERIVPVLNELLGRLVPIIRDQHGGYVNKFLGDGIMFFFNAPLPSPTHAADAVATVLEMHHALEQYNQALRGQGLGELSMRAGIVTGEMIVGDAGGAKQNDYTVLGDAVNLAARLEPANKLLGTHTLISARTCELLEGRFIVCPIGRIKVVGRDEAVFVYEPLATAEQATAAQRQRASLWTEALAQLERGKVDEFESALSPIAAAGFDAPLVEIYRSMCETHRAAPEGTAFDATIVLMQK